MTPTDIQVLELADEHRSWARGLIEERWSGLAVVVHETVYYPDRLPGFIAVAAAQPVGLVTYQIEGRACEIVTLDAVLKVSGIGSSLVHSVRKLAEACGCTRVWLVTTNDNIDAIRFYQRRGFRFARLRPGAIEHARRTKPNIPLIGDYGIPIRDELEFEMTLPSA